MRTSSENPYISANCDDALRSGDERRSMVGRVVVICILGTFGLAFYDALDQGVNLSWAFVCSIAACVSQMPGLVLAWITKKHWLFDICAIFVGTTAIIAYLSYALNGAEGSSRSSAQLHVIFFPIVHSLLAFVLYSLAGLHALVSLPRKTD